MRHPARCFFLAILTLTAVPATAQSPPQSLRRVRWPLADFIVLGDSTHGVQVLASPNLRSRQGRVSMDQATLSVDPVGARRWARGVAELVDSVAALPARQRTPFESAPLPANLGQTRLLVSFDGKGPMGRPFVFVVNEGTREGSWWVEVSAAELRKLLAAIDTTAQRSAVSPRTDSLPGGVSLVPYLICELDEPPVRREPLRLVHPGEGRRLGREGRVLTQYVIDTTGAVVVDSLRVLLTDGEDLTRAVVRALRDARYLPGRLDGRPVATVMWHWFGFTTER